MNITGHTVEKLEDPTGILTGDRYEWILKIEVPEEDELFSENGLYIKAIYVVEEGKERIAQYNIYENETNNYLEFELEEEEVALLLNYCQQQL